MAGKQKVVITFQKTVKSASYGGKASKKHMEMLIRRMYPDLNVNDIEVYTSDGQNIDLRTMADLCNRNNQHHKFEIKRSQQVDQSDNDQKSRNRHSRNNSGPGKSVRELVSSPEKKNWPEILESDYPTVLFNTTSLKKLSTLVESNLAQEQANFLYRIIENEFSEAVYLYRQGFLTNSIELNDNIEMNLKRFFKTYRQSQDTFELVDAADQKEDHIPMERFKELLVKFESESLMAADDISALIRAYNVRPLLVKSMVRDYFDDIIQLPALA